MHLWALQSREFVRVPLLLSLKEAKYKIKFQDKENLGASYVRNSANLCG